MTSVLPKNYAYGAPSGSVVSAASEKRLHIIIITNMRSIINDEEQNY